MSTISACLSQSEFEFAGPSVPIDAIEPLRCDRWIASSALQKAIRRGDVLTAQRALRTLYRHDPRSAWRRLLVIACEDVGIGSLGAVIMAIRLGTDTKACREAGGDEAAAFATAQMLAERPEGPRRRHALRRRPARPRPRDHASSMPLRSGRPAARIGRRPDVVLARARPRRLAFFRG